MKQEMQEQMMKQEKKEQMMKQEKKEQIMKQEKQEQMKQQRHLCLVERPRKAFCPPLQHDNDQRCATLPLRALALWPP